MQTPRRLDPWRWWQTLQPQQRLLAAAGQIVVGLALTFFGYRLFRAFLAISGFLLGASLGLSIGAAMTPAVRWIVALALGLLGAVVLWALFRLGALLAGAALGLAAAQAAIAAIPAASGSEWQWLMLLVGLVLGAALGWRLQRPLIIIATALWGAWGSLAGLAMLVGRGTPQQAVPAALGPALFSSDPSLAWQSGGGLWLLATLLLALLGIAFQLRDTARMRPRRF